MQRTIVALLATIASLLGWVGFEVHELRTHDALTEVVTTQYRNLVYPRKAEETTVAPSTTGGGFLGAMQDENERAIELMLTNPPASAVPGPRR